MNRVSVLLQLLQSLHSDLMTMLDVKSSYVSLVRPAAKPRPLKQLEPRITEKYVQTVVNEC